MPEIDPFKKHFQFFIADGAGSLIILWPGELVFLKTLLPEAKSIAIPIECFFTASCKTGTATAWL
nr:hypothetical protein [Salinispira pacifica]